VRRRMLGCLAAGAVLTAAVPGVAAAAYDAGDPAQKAAYDAAYAVAADAYQYGAPLLTMDRTFRTSTSVNVPNGRGGGPVNAFSSFTQLADARDRTVVAPNADTLYSMAWLDLSGGPQVVTASPTDRFHVLELLSPYEENFANVGSPRGAYADGSYAVTPPGWKGTLPRGVRRIKAPYDRVWIVGRTYVRDKRDVAAVRKVMARYRVTPLKRFDPARPLAYTPPKPKRRDTTIDAAHVPGTGAGEDPATFFDALGDQLARFAPPAADRPALQRFAALGVGVGQHPTAGGLSEPQLQALRDAVTKGRATVQSNLLSRYLAAFDAHNGWLVGDTGRYGTDYALRAVVDQFGLGAPVPSVSVYPMALLDRDRAPLTGAKRYVAHFPPGAVPPPVKFFWSMTLYDSDSFFVDNPLDRYLVNDRSDLRKNADGSLDVYLQPEAPADAAQRANWLPTPKASAKTPGFRLMVRLYGLSASGVKGLISGSGWQGPTVLPCLADGKTRTGVACAS
jgi:hypothetical protein